jgi:hypothetical protein
VGFRPHSVLPINRPKRERYFKRYTTVVSVSAGLGVGSPYISHEFPAESLRFSAIHFRNRVVRLIHAVVRAEVDEAAIAGVSVEYTSPAVSNVRVTSTPKSQSIGAPACVGWW